MQESKQEDTKSVSLVQNFNYIKFRNKLRRPDTLASVSTSEAYFVTSCLLSCTPTPEKVCSKRKFLIF